MADQGGGILVTGAVGQIGAELTMALRERHSGENVVAVGHVTKPSERLRQSGPFETCDVRDVSALGRIIDRHHVDTVFHLAAVSSAVSERDARLAWDVNVNGLRNVLEVARERRLSRVFVPSCIAVFGSGAPKSLAPQDALSNQAVTRGLTKVVGEELAERYVREFGLDVRGLRYPAIVSSEASPTGRATDYAVEIFYAADVSGNYQCCVREDAVLPMMYLPDCIKATLALMDAPRESLSRPVWYDVGGMSFSAGDLVREIKRHLPGFVCSFVTDKRQAIVDSWPDSLDDRAARRDWNWRPEHNLETMVADLIGRLFGAPSPADTQA